MHLLISVLLLVLKDNKPKSYVKFLNFIIVHRFKENPNI